MDKIREEFEKIFKDVDFTDEDIPEFVLKAQCYEGFEAGYKSRDEGIKKLRDEFDRFLGAVKQHINCLESKAALAVVQNAVNYYDSEALKDGE